MQIPVGKMTEEKTGCKFPPGMKLRFAKDGNHLRFWRFIARLGRFHRFFYAGMPLAERAVYIQRDPAHLVITSWACAIG